MAHANATWGEERIAAELQLKLGITVSPRTVRRYMRRGGRPHDQKSSERLSTFVRNHAAAVLACDFFVTVTATFRMADCITNITGSNWRHDRAGSWVRPQYLRMTGHHRTAECISASVS